MDCSLWGIEEALIGGNMNGVINLSRIWVNGNKYGYVDIYYKLIPIEMSYSGRL